MTHEKTPDDGLDERHAVQVERWLRDEVVPVIAALDADPSLAIPAVEARKRIWAAIDVSDERRRTLRRHQVVGDT
jgi:hypothetical protein